MKMFGLVFAIICLLSVVNAQIAPLGIESRAIPDSSLSAFSEFDANHRARRGRLNTVRVGAERGAWSARTNDAHQWIQVDLGSPYEVHAMATQGRQDEPQWVTSYKVTYSIDSVAFDTVTAYGVDVVFGANSDQDTVVRNTLPVPLVCRYLRLLPVTWHGHISLRMELYGTGPIESPIDAPLGFESHTIPDSNLRSSSRWNALHGPRRGRLNAVRVGNERGAWSARTNDANQWIQVDLGAQYHVVAVATQGRQDHPQWVTSYKVTYSDDAINFDTIRASGLLVDAVFAANFDQDTVVRNTLPTPVVCRYVRLLPVTWHSHISLRMELYGHL